MTEPIAEPVVVDPEPLPELPSIADHAAQFSADAQKAQAEETPDEKSARVALVAQQKRDKDTGQFREGKTRHRAASQQARAEDVPRIKELTAKHRASEERAERLESELAQLKASRAPAPVIAQAERNVEAAKGDTSSFSFSEAEPDENDPKFAGDYGKYLRAAAKWEGRKAYFDQKQADRVEAQKAESAAKQEASLKTWADRVGKAREKHPDFDAVAFAETKIRKDSAVDTFVMEDDNGPEVLYYLQSHPQELDSLLTGSVLAQLKALSLLSQRFESLPAVAAGLTGAAPRPEVKLPPKPPTPVRTEAQRVSEAPPPTDGSLSIAEHKRAFAPVSRR